MQKLNPNVRLPYKYIKGSVKQRQKLISDLNEVFFDSFQNLVQQKKCRLNDIKDLYIKNLPEPKKINIVKLKNNNTSFGASDYIYKNEDIVGITLELFLEKNRISPCVCPVFMHENTHVLYSLVNPKTVILTQKMNKEFSYDTRYDKLFDENLYAVEKLTPSYTKKDMLENFKEAVLKFLKHKTCYEKINFLQDTRYLLEEEAFAYSEEVKYARKLKDMGYDISIDNLCNFNYIYYFKEKAEVLKELAFEIITKKRKQIALQNKKM